MLTITLPVYPDNKFLIGFIHKLFITHKKEGIVLRDFHGYADGINLTSIEIKTILFWNDICFR